MGAFIGRSAMTLELYSARGSTPRYEWSFLSHTARRIQWGGLQAGDSSLAIARFLEGTLKKPGDSMFTFGLPQCKDTSITLIPSP